MAIAKGTALQVAYKKETAFGTIAGNTGGKLLRRVTANFNSNVDFVESGEIRVDRQVADYRGTTESADGSLNGELSAGSYSEFFGAICAKDFASAPTAASLSVTIAASGSLYSVTRAAGSWITDGFSVGNVFRLTGGTLNVANSGKNLVIAAVTATILTVSVLNGSTLVAEGPIASVTATAAGKVTSVPLTAHTDNSYTIENWYSDIAQSETFTGLKVNSVAVQLPATGLTTIDIGFAGKSLTQTGTTQYFTSPTAQSTTGIMAAANGVMLANGVPVALITSADFTIDRATENAVAVGSKSVQDIFTGKVKVSGNLSIYFTDATFRDYFRNETPVSLVMTLSADSTGTSDFISFTLPKVKLGSFTKADAELGITASASFMALLNSTTTGGLPATTIAIQDSQA